MKRKLTDLSNDELALLNLAKDILRKSKAKPSGATGAIVKAYSNDDYDEAIKLVKKLLRSAGLDAPKSYDVDYQRFQLLRDAKDIGQKDVANALGVTVSAISNFERGSGTLSLAGILMACDVLGIPASEIISPKKETK